MNGIKAAIWDNSRTFDIADLPDFATLRPQIKEYFAVFGTTPPSIANDNYRIARGGVILCQPMTEHLLILHFIA
jgi:hypothetical protein